MQFRLFKHLISTTLVLFTTVVSNATDLIANTSVSVQSLSKEEARLIFTLKKSYWDDGSKIKIFLLPKESVVTKTFMRDVLGMPTQMYFDLIDSEYTSGRANIPIKLKNEISMVVEVSNSSGSIGYVYSTRLVESIPNIKVIVVK